MTPEIKDTILDALYAYRGDDYERAKAAFRGYSDIVLDGEYGQSGKTRRQVLEEHATTANGNGSLILSHWLLESAS